MPTSTQARSVPEAGRGWGLPRPWSANTPRTTLPFALGITRPWPAGDTGQSMASRRGHSHHASGSSGPCSLGGEALLGLPATPPGGKK